jgi:hypothetical protein
LAWTGQEDRLAQYVDGLFIWATVATEFLQSGDDLELQLDELLAGTSSERINAEVKLDRLFLDVLHRSLPEAKGIHVNNWRYVLGSIVALKIPLTCRDMDSLLGFSSDPQK